jgi:hypothetical protein
VNFRDRENQNLDFCPDLASIGTMTTLGLSLRERVSSRLLFYVLLVSGLAMVNRVLPDPAALEAARWEALGVAKPYLGVPYERVERELFRQSR